MLLVIGATSHTGTFFFKKLVQEKYKERIRCFVRESSDINFLKNSPLNIDFFYGDLNDSSAISKSMFGITNVLNIAGIRFSEKIIEIGCRYSVEWFICVHTTGKYSRFRSASAHYVEIEDRIINEQSNVTILRPTLIYGSSGDRNMWKLINYLYKNRLFPVFGAGKNLLQPVHAKDLGVAYYQVLINKEKTFGKEYNLSGNNKLAYKDLIREISNGLNRKTILIHLPIWFSIMAVYIYNFFLGSSASIKVEQVLRMKEDKVFSWENAFKDLNYNPMTFEDGIQIELKEFLNLQNK